MTVRRAVNSRHMALTSWDPEVAPAVKHLRRHGIRLLVWGSPRGCIALCLCHQHQVSRSDLSSLTDLSDSDFSRSTFAPWAVSHDMAMHCRDAHLNCCRKGIQGLRSAAVDAMIRMIPVAN